MSLSNLPEAEGTQLPPSFLAQEVTQPPLPDFVAPGGTRGCQGETVLRETRKQTHSTVLSTSMQVLAFGKCVCA